ncbi:MAG: hypothetical protein ABI588_09860 [Arenimonas sp.]
MSMKVVRAAAVLACALAAFPSAAQLSEASIVRADFTDSTLAGLAGTKRVAITNVIVSFQASVGATKAAGSGMFADKSSSTSLMALPDMDPALQDAIVAQAYNDLKSNLIAAGYEIVPEAEVAADPNYTAIIGKVGFANHSKSLNALGDAILVSPPSLTPYMPYTAEGGLFEAGVKGYLGWGSGWGKPATPGGFSLMKAGTIYQLPGMEVALAKSLNAHVVKAFYVVNIGHTSAAHSRSLGTTITTTATANAFAQLGLLPDQTRIAFRTPNGNAKWQKVSMTKPAPAKDGDVVVHLGEPMLGSTGFFDVSGDGGHERGGWLLASGDFKFSYLATINDAAAYQAEAQAMIASANRSMLALVKQ